MNVAGIDYSSHAIDIVLVPLDQGAPTWHRFELAGQDAFERARRVADVMPGRHTVWWDQVLAVGIEHPAGRHGVGPLLRIQGAVLACIPPRMLVEPWPPGKWRKAVGLSGSAPKATVAAESIARAFWTGPGGFGYVDWPQDAHDAHLIALATRQALNQQEAA